MKKLFSLLAALLVVGAGCVSTQRATPQATADSAALARQLVATRQAAIVTVVGTLKATTTVKGMGMKREDEAPIEAAATVVDASGLVVAGNMLLDPVSSMLHGPMRIKQGDQTLEVEIKSHMENLRILFADKTERPARVITKDDDLGLTVLAMEPKAGEKAPRFTAVPLVGETTPQLYAPCFVLGRTGASHQRTPLVGRGFAVNALTKPHPSHVFMTSMMPLGLPVFAADGRLVGIGSLDYRPPDLENLEKAAQQKARPLPIILPVADVRNLVARAQKSSGRSAVEPKPTVALAPTQNPMMFGEIPGDQARVLIAAKQDAIVTLRGSVKFNCGHCPQTHDEDIECVATLVDPAGFAVCGSGGKAADRKYEEQRLNFILRDGTEVPARIVLQDDDLMLTVLVPAPKPGTPLPVLSTLPLQGNVKAKLFDDVLAINRLDREHHNVITADTGKIAACITQPRVFYLTDANPGGSLLGAPTFLADGRLLGVLARQTPTTKQRRSRESFAGAGEGLHVVPATGLAELVAQARKVAAKK